MIFKRTVEDFTCAQCGAYVRGSGFTNHCPVCLWSKHVDIHPGDRAAACGGMMKPVSVEGSSPDYTLVHRCLVCAMERRNRTVHQDSAAAIVALASAASSRGD